MARRAIILVVLIAAALAACGANLAPEPKIWVGGDPAHLAADQGACRKETEDVGLGANGFSDSRYGVAAALAEAEDRDDPLKNHRADARAAAFITCMNDEGWHPG